MRFFIPAIGTRLRLLEPWTFLLYVEKRNSSLFEAFGTDVQHLVWEDVDPYWGYGQDVPNLVSHRDKFQVITSANGKTFPTIGRAARFMLPAGTLLKVTRIYIRSGQGGEFDSVTLAVTETTHPFLVYAGKTKTGNRTKVLGKFWVKLVDFNTITGEIVEDNARPHKQC